MKYFQIIVVKRWIPILKEYERTKVKNRPHYSSVFMKG